MSDVEKLVSEEVSTNNDNDTSNDTHMHHEHGEEEEYLAIIEEFYTPPLFEIPTTETENRILLEPETLYQTILALSKDNANTLHHYLMIILNPSQQQEHHIARAKVISAFWNFLEEVVQGGHSFNTGALQLFFRYGLLISSAVPKDIINVILTTDCSAPPQNSVYYMDEILVGVSRGTISPASVETTTISKESQILTKKQQMKLLQSQNSTQISNSVKLDQELNQQIEQIKKAMTIVSDRPNTEFGFNTPISPGNIGNIKTLHNVLRVLGSKNEQLQINFDNIKKNTTTIEEIQSALAHTATQNSKENNNDTTQTSIEKKIIIQEIQSIHKMTKHAVGRKGNHFPILLEQYFHGPINNFGTREQVNKTIREIEMIDYTLFQRRIKGVNIRMFPQVFLVPCYANTGFCWEPFNFYQRNTSSSKIVIPMYSQNLLYTVCSAMGDYRWQIAKEIAGKNWMDEGLTGWYYQWYDSTIKKGDAKLYFIADYCAWIRWESIGTQKIPKEVRKTFWHFIPFTKEHKNTLKRRAPVYAKLMKQMG